MAVECWWVGDQPMKALITLILVLLAGTSYGQSNLPACQGSDASKWSYCFGTYTEIQGSWKGDKYVGEFGALGVFHGKGTYFHLAENQWKGDKYVGEYVSGKRKGEGTYYYLANNQFKGDKYVGEWKDGQQNGQGTYAYKSGEKYVGEWKDAKQNGQGTFYYLADNQFKGDTYVGEHKDGKKNGQGTYIWNSGNKYVGEFKDDASGGQGTFTFIDGRVWLGEWSNWKLNGRGITYSANGSVQHSGIYKDNVLVTSQYIDPNSFKRIARNNTAPAVSDSQRQAIEQRERQIELEAERLAEERRRLDAQKAQIEQEKKASRIAIKSSASQPDANGDFTINIQTGADVSSPKR